MKLDKKETYLPVFNLTQLKEYSKLLKTTQTYSTQKYSRIRYSTQRLDTQLKDMIFDSGYSTLDTQLNIKQQYTCNIWKAFKTIEINSVY